MNSAVGRVLGEQQLARRGALRAVLVRRARIERRVLADAVARRAPRGSRAGARRRVCRSRAGRRGRRCAGGRRRAGATAAARAPPALSAEHDVGVDEARAGGRRRRAPRRRRGRAAGSCGRSPAGAMIRPSTRRARNASASSRSRSGPRRSCRRRSSTPRSRATSSTPRCTAREERVGDVLEDQADAGRQPVGAAQRAGGQVVAVAEQLDRRVDPLGEVGATLGPPLTTRETVLRLTPATAATSLHRRAPAVRVVRCALRQRTFPHACPCRHPSSHRRAERIRMSSRKRILLTRDDSRAYSAASCRKRFLGSGEVRGESEGGRESRRE